MEFCDCLDFENKIQLSEKNVKKWIFFEIFLSKNARKYDALELQSKFWSPIWEVSVSEMLKFFKNVVFNPYISVLFQTLFLTFST